MNLIESLSYTPVELSFGTSGLRGLVVTMTDLECYINAAGFLEFSKAYDGLKPGETIYLAGDLRADTPRVMHAVAAAVRDGGYKVHNCGLIPIPALAYYALQHNSLGIMVTGSHIPADRDGIKFYKRAGEVLKSDEGDIHTAVARVRERLYNQAADRSAFDNDGSMKALPQLEPADDAARQAYLQRYLDVFPADSLTGKKIAVYQQSSVARDLLVELLEDLGADATAFGRSDDFIPIDTDNITPEDEARFKRFSREYTGSFAIVSGDGDCDRPIVVDENGVFHRGDLLGCLAAQYLGAKFAAVPIICNDAVDEFCAANNITLAKTKVGSPHVIAAMMLADHGLQPAVAWEMNGGFLTAHDISMHGKTLRPLPTRDAVLPMLCALQMAVQQNVPLSAIFDHLPKRYASQGLIDDVPEAEIKKFRSLAENETVMQRLADKLVSDKLGQLQSIDQTDGLRMVFASGDVLHLRPSANAPQFRVYTNAATQMRAQALVDDAIKPGGYIMRLLGSLRTVEETVGHF